MLQSMGSQRLRHDLATEQEQQRPPQGLGDFVQKEGIKHSWRMSRCQFRPERKTQLQGWIDEDE